MVLYQTIVLWCSIITSVMSASLHSKNYETENCDEDFTDHVDKCLLTFSPYLDHLNKTIPRDPFIKSIFIQNVCRNYKKMLFCVHTVLTNCKTMQNIETVQQKLGHDWVIQINTMCGIQSNSSQSFSKSENLTASSYHKNSDHSISQSNKETNFEDHKSSLIVQKDNSLTKLTIKSVLLQKLLHSSDIDVRFVAMLVFQPALETTK